MKVFVIATGDPCWENEVSDYPMFGDNWTVQLEEGFLIFKKLTGKWRMVYPYLISEYVHGSRSFGIKGYRTLTGCGELRF